MKFTEFKNGNDFLEYIQIYVYYHLHEKKDDVNIDDYNSFELTDAVVTKFNRWVKKIQDNDPVILWFRQNKEITEAFKAGFGTIYKPKVCLWSDRKKTEYYKEKLQMGFDFENYIAELISDKYGINLEPYLTPEGQYELGENSLGIEIKNDTLINNYGNIYIEYQEKSKSSNWGYVNSGILKVDNCVYWLIGTPDKFYIFRKERLLEIFNEEVALLKRNLPSKRGIKFKQIATSRGFVYPAKNAEKNKDTISMDEMMSEIKSRLKLE